MTVEELFDELAQCFAVTIDDHMSTHLCYPDYYCPEDRCGDDTQPMVEMLDGDLCIEPSDVEKIVTADYMVTVHLKGGAHPWTFQFLNVKKFEADQFDKKIKPHTFEVFDGDDASNETTWCKHCNTARNETDGLHI